MHQRANAPNLIYYDITASGQRSRNITTFNKSFTYHKDTPGFFPSLHGDRKFPSHSVLQSLLMGERKSHEIIHLYMSKKKKRIQILFTPVPFCLPAGCYLGTGFKNYCMQIRSSMFPGCVNLGGENSERILNTIGSLTHREHRILIGFKGYHLPFLSSS